MPAFIDSKASLLIQLADAVAWAINRKIKGDDRFYALISKKFDYDKGKQHGLYILADDNIRKVFE